MRALLVATCLAIVPGAAGAQLMELSIVAARAPRGLGSLSEMPRIRDCGRVEARVGKIRGTGSIEYLLTDQGEPDTSTVAVVEHDGMSEAGFRSAARRLLAGCRFTPARQAGARVEVVVTQRVGFATREPDLGPLMAPRLAGAPAPASTPSATPADSVEEFPGVVSCSRVPSRILGKVTMEYEVGVDGQGVPGSARALDVSNPEIGGLVERFAMACRFTPGRLHGEPIPVRIQQTFQVR